MNFQCGSCGNLIDVEKQFLGQPIRCPHCEQIVQTQAPLPTFAPPARDMSPEITFSVPPAGDEESIFETTEQAGDDLFGSAPAPKIEIPPEPQAALTNAEIPVAESASSSVRQLGDAGIPREMKTDESPVQPAAEQRLGKPTAWPSPENPSAAPLESWTDFRQAAALSGGLEQATRDSRSELPEVGFFQAPAESASTEAGDSPLAPASDSLLRNLPQRAVPSGMRSGMFIALVVIPLISYSILATIAVIILYMRPPQPSLEYLPDVEGDFHGSKRQKQSSISYERLDPDSPLPDRLKIDLKHSIRLGDVEVTPMRVEWSRLKIRHPDMTQDLLPGEALTLHLKLKNVSADVAFSPTDPYFDRQWKSAQDSKPYTFLEIGSQRVYGGPLPWRPGMRADNRPALDGQTYQVLEPGAQTETFVCTPPGDSTVNTISSDKAPLLWRVHVRRGLVRVGRRDVSATAVFGVAFRAADIQKPL